MVFWVVMLDDTQGAIRGDVLLEVGKSHRVMA
jgi:hypothetical protein